MSMEPWSRFRSASPRTYFLDQTKTYTLTKPDKLSGFFVRISEVLDTNWETINGAVAQQIELTNATNQTNVLTCLISFLLAHRGPSGQWAPPPLDEAALMTLHQAGTLFLLANPGEYRNIEVKVRNTRGEITLEPCHWQEVPGNMKWFFRNFCSLWQMPNPLDVAAFALWGINYIHPFRNGNGRTARAFSYACLSLKMGALLSGSPNIMDLMTIDPDKTRYNDLLAEADKAFLASGRPDLGTLNLEPLKQFILDLLNRQFMAVAQSAASSIPP